MNNLKISVILGSTRPNRFSEKPGQWIFEQAKKQADVDVELLDLRDYPMPFFDQPMSPTMSKGQYPNPTVKKWAGKIAEADAYIIVTPEYNHGYPAVLKNAMDFVYFEWNNKPVAFVSYGSVGGGRGVEQLRLVSVELQMAPIRQGVFIPGAYPFGMKEWNPEADETLTRDAGKMFEQLLWWAKALKNARE